MSVRFRTHEAAELYASMTTGSQFVVPDADLRRNVGELVLNVSEGCNLACTYCFAGAGKYGASESRWMSPDTARKAVRSFADRYDQVETVKFFGGEPMMNLRAIEAAIEEFTAVVDAGLLRSQPRYGMVSNMTIYNTAIKNLICENRLVVTGSIDGPQPINDVGRVYPGGRGSFSRIDATISRMRAETGEPSALELVFGPLHVASGYSMVDMHRYLTDRYGVERVIISPLIDNRDHDPGYQERMVALAEEYGRYLVDLAVKFGRSADVRHGIKNFLNRNRSTLLCGLGYSILTVNASGELYPCYTMLGSPEWEMAKEPPSSRVLLPSEIHVRGRLQAASKLRMSACVGCALISTCGGCPGSNIQMGMPIDQPIQSSCELQIAQAEGMLLRLIEVHSDPAEWVNFASALARRP